MDLLTKDMYDFVVVGEEVCTSTGTPHYQGYIQFKRQLYRSQVSKIFPTAWLGVANGTAQENYAYCTEDGQWMEDGTMIVQHRLTNAEVIRGNEKRGKVRAEQWSDIISLCKQGDFDTLQQKYPGEFYRYYQNGKRIYQDYQKRPADLADVCGEWIYGAPGIGKSYMARQENPDFYDKPFNKWWDGFQQEKTVILDDLDMTHKAWIGSHLKRWADRYSFPGEMKGTTKQLRPQKIVVTSNYTIEEVFGEDLVLVAALKRRFTVRHIVQPYHALQAAAPKVADAPQVVDKHVPRKEPRPYGFLAGLQIRQRQTTLSEDEFMVVEESDEIEVSGQECDSSLDLDEI